MGRAFVAMAAALALTGCATPVGTLDGGPPLVIAHRGASGERPEHTLAAYALAIEQGADFIEPDLVMSKDGALVARHDRYLSTTTDVADRPEFAARKTTKLADDGPRADWWAEDFTLAELKTLRARQPFPGRSREFDGRFDIPTFAEAAALAKAESAKRGRVIGVYPETKHPGALAALGLDMEGALIRALEAEGWTDRGAPVLVQSFEPAILQSLKRRIGVRLIQLVLPDPANPGQPNIPLAALTAWADGVGPNKRLLVDADGKPTGFIAEAHKLGLVVHAWTVRDDQPPPDGAAPKVELARLYRAGVDGVFADFPATAVAVRSETGASPR